MPAARITNSTNQAADVGGTTAAVSFDTVKYDTSGFYSGTHPTRLTAPVAGIYAISASAIYSPNSTGLRILNLAVNGSTLVGAVQVDSNGSSEWDTCISVATQVKLAAGDYVIVEQGAPETTGSSEIVAEGELPSLEMTWLDDS